MVTGPQHSLGMWGHPEDSDCSPGSCSNPEPVLEQLRPLSTAPNMKPDSFGAFFAKSSVSSPRNSG